MVDEFYDRAYQEARVNLNAALGAAAVRASRAVLDAFKVLNRIEYDAPWNSTRRRARSR